MYQRFDEFRNFDIFDEELGNSRPRTSFALEKTHNERPTEDPNTVGPEVTLRSNKKHLDTPETSIESTFFNQHHEAFNKQVENYIESCAPNCKTDSKNLLNATLFNPKGNQHTVTLQQLLNSSQTLLPVNSILEFQNQLKAQKKLKEFLSYVVSQCYENTAGELLFLAFKTWEAYLSFQNDELDTPSLRNFATKFVTEKGQEFYNSICISSLGMKGMQDKLKVKEENSKAHLMQFLNFYCQTVILVITEHFCNPYFEDEESPTNPYKRYIDAQDNFSEDELEEDFGSHISSYKRFKAATDYY